MTTPTEPPRVPSMKPDRDAKSGALAHPSQGARRPIRRRKAGSVNALQKLMSGALLSVEEALNDPTATTADRLKAANAIASIGGAYSRVHEQSELLPRLEAVEANQKKGIA